MRAAAAAMLATACATPRAGGPVVQQLESELGAARLRAAQCEARMERCAEETAPTALYRELRAVFADGEVRVVREGTRSAVVLPADLVFGGDGLRIRQEAAMALDLLATAIRLHPEVRARVTAHTDAAAPPEAVARVQGDLLALTTAQARVLLEELVERHGVPRRQLVAAGQGADAPLSPGETPLEQARNRRVVVVFELVDPWDRPGSLSD